MLRNYVIIIIIRLLICDIYLGIPYRDWFRVPRNPGFRPFPSIPIPGITSIYFGIQKLPAVQKHR